MEVALKGIVSILIGLSLFAGLSFGQTPTFIEKAASRKNITPTVFLNEICDIRNDAISSRVFREYGSVFVAAPMVVTPAKCVFESEEQTAQFEAAVKFTRSKIADVEISLQTEAMRSLQAAIDEADQAKLRITPLDGAIAGSRTYADTVKLWNSRFYRALEHWQGRKRISKKDADAARALPAYQQVPLVLKWEEDGLWFSTGFSRSILTSVAAPGTSQHLSGLAFDVVEYRYAKVRAILNKHGWFQTVAADEPHFTFLGMAETELPAMGLKTVTRGGYKYWVPAL